MANEYATLSELKSMRRVADVVDDTALQAALTRASRAIDDRCARYFYRDGTASARTFDARGGLTTWGLFIVDDIASTTGLAVETTTGAGNSPPYEATTDYQVRPSSALTRGRPVTALSGLSSYLTSVRVTAEWGWPRVPDAITEATLLLANRRFMRRDSPEGVSGWSQEGPVRVSRFDPDIEDLISPYTQDGFA